jgi:hypothetical protein
MPPQYKRSAGCLAASVGALYVLVLFVGQNQDIKSARRGLAV